MIFLECIFPMLNIILAVSVDNQICFVLIDFALLAKGLFYEHFGSIRI